MNFFSRWLAARRRKQQERRPGYGGDGGNSIESDSGRPYAAESSAYLASMAMLGMQQQGSDSPTPAAGDHASAETSEPMQAEAPDPGTPADSGGGSDSGSSASCSTPS